MTSFVRPAFLAVLLVLSIDAPSAPGADVRLANWPVPSATGRGTMAPLADTADPTVFIPYSPCRLVDTRGATGAYGGPKLSGGSSRSFDLNSHPTCTGIPYGVSAYSLNFTVTETDGAGFLLVYPTGSAAPTVSTVNYVAGQTVANAAIVPADAAGSISVVAGVSGTHVIVDVNGYFLGRSAIMNTGEYLGLYGNRDGGGVLHVFNGSQSVSTSTSSIRGVFGSWSAGQAILGETTGETGLVYGVRGTTESRTGSAAGVKGEATYSSGQTYGVHGTTDSTSNCASGIRGESGSAIPCTYNGPVGIWGASSGLSGVVGQSSNASGRGVQGVRVDAAGNFLTTGVLGYTGTSGVHSFQDLTAGGTKSFVEPHPADASREIVYVALEGPEAGTYFRGRGRFAGGRAVIPVPEDFRLVTSDEGLTCQLTPIGRPVAFAVTRLTLEGIEAEATGDVEFSYIVHGVRRHYEGFRPVQENVHFVPPSAEAAMDPWPAHLRQRLVDVGIYNADGTPNLDTARRLGWKAAWDEAKAREEARQRSVQEARAREKAAEPPVPR
ncbi:MAG: hypothetical protein IPP07_09315 [Holophagales bacterium]|nr:hypothetical protein [Holophagales bacterium]MBK9965068.1 hypothetical protein [Holophagales bacterium]